MTVAVGYKKDGFVSLSLDEIQSLEGDAPLEGLMGEVFFLAPGHSPAYPIPQELKKKNREYIFGKIPDSFSFGELEDLALVKLSRIPCDWVFIYVTGLAVKIPPLLIAAINVLRLYHKNVVVMHYDRESGAYKSQIVY